MAVITKQELEDAQRDATDLGLVVNGPSNLNGNGLVPTRLGGSVKTLRNILDAAEDIVDQIGTVGDNADRAEAARDVAIAAGVQYISEAAAVAGLADGAFGSYLDEDGNPIWGQRVGASMVALPGPWIDADKIGSDDDASGTIWTTVAGFITRLMSSAGASVIGFIQAGTGAVARTVQSKLWDTVSVKDFGAVGDGVTDDTAAINAAYIAAEAAGGLEVFWPAGEYKATGTITCGPMSSTRAAAGAVLTYSGTGTAFEVQGVNTSETNGQFHVMPYINRTALDWNSGTDTTSVGLLLSDRKYNTFVIPGVKRFNEGVALKADAANFVCNTLQLGVIQNNRIGIDFSRVTSGRGINQNNVMGGACVIDSAYTSAANRISINMPNATENNTNTFIGVNLEKGGNEKGIVCASSSNVFLNCRFEGGGSTPGYVTVSGNNNRFTGGAPASSATIPFVTWISDSGSGNTWQMANIIANKFMAWDTHSVSKPLRFGNGSAYPAVPIGPFGTDRLALGDSATLAARHWGLMQQEGTAVTTGTTLPWRSALVLSYASATTITGMAATIGLTDTSAIVAITSTNGNATLQHTTSPAVNAGRFVLKGGANLTLTANTPVIFQLVSGNLYQI